MRHLHCAFVCVAFALFSACGGDDIVNSKPVAHAGDLAIVNVGDVVALDAAASTDGDNDALDYLWSFESKPEASTASIVDASAVSTSFLPDKAGVYRIGLVVNDGSVDSDKAFKTVQVLNYRVSFYTDNGRTLLDTVFAGPPNYRLPLVPEEGEKPGYVFVGWFTQADGAGERVSAGAVIDGNLVAYDCWSAFAYTISFAAPDATTPPVPATLLVSSPANTLAGLPTIPARTGYLFGGWFTEPDGGGSRVTANSVFGSDSTVYAKWDSYRYLVVFNDSGATVPVGTASIAVESPARFVGVLPAAPVKTGYAFGGWFTEPDGSGEPFTATTPVTDTLVLYASWLTYSWNVTFNAPDATTAPSFASKTVASPQTQLGALPAAPARTGYLFGGWYTGPDGSGTAVTATSALSGSTDLYAKWNSYTYTVAFDSAGADSPASPSSKTVASPSTTAGTLPAAPVRTGFTFSGWYTAPNGGGTAFTASSPVVADTTVYAKWLPNSAVSVEVSIPGSGPVTILNDNPVVSKGSTVSVRVAQTGYERYQWYLDGVLQGAAGSTISINTSAMEAGVHSLMVVIADSQGAGASASCRFTIEN